MGSGRRRCWAGCWAVPCVVYLTVFPELVWEGTEKTQPEKVVRSVIGRLHDMDLDVDGGASAVRTLLDSGAVEIVRRAA